MGIDSTSSVIRDKFFEFFKLKGHDIQPSAPMVVKNDPTLMFTNAGMNQFKDLFLGVAKPSNKRVANSQKCLRVSGKHNDLEEVGVDTYHHTMFEMLGNWSFGDYFKKEAIEWAWELLTEHYKIDKSRLYITVFGGDNKEGTEADIEAEEIWKKWVPTERILRCGKKDNFWEMGEIGPCGPCSEIHIDLRPQEEIDKLPGNKLVNEDHPQVIEIWNLVFIQFNRLKSRKLEPLPEKHVDTGMGLERLVRVLQNKSSNYDSDLFVSVISELEKKSDLKYNFSDSKNDIAFRVIADHIRAVAFSITDGQLPSNTGAGYVIRRILRRAIRYAYSYLNFKKPVIHSLVDVLVDVLGGHYTELQKQKTLIEKVIFEEESSFLKTLERGLIILDKHTSENNAQVEGKTLFELYDTFGFPLDLTLLILSEKGISADVDGFNLELKAQKDRSRAASQQEIDDWIVLNEGSFENFVGYDELKADIKVLKYRKVTEKGKQYYQAVFNTTPFYSEGGGQVGDVGFLRGDKNISIVDTKKENGEIVHYLKDEPTAVNYVAEVNSAKRNETQKHHSATHLLHYALRKHLGTHVEQKGSLVNSEYLRFDFSHFEKVSDEIIKSIELEINNEITKAVSLNEKRDYPIAEAKKMGAMALFGEKYGESVRVVQFGDSVELCGGTHVQNTALIGAFKIVSEGSVAAGVRRVEAVCGKAAFSYLNKALESFNSMVIKMGSPKDPIGAIEKTLAENVIYKKQLAVFKKEQEKLVFSQIKSDIEEVNGVSIYASELQLDSEQIKNIAFSLKNANDRLVFIAGSKATGKPMITILLADDIVKEFELNAGMMVRESAKLIQGGGGGQPFFATAGGKNSDGLNDAIAFAKKMVTDKF